MNDSLDPLMNNLSKNIHNTKCNHCMKCKHCKTCEEFEICKDFKNSQTIVINVTKYIKSVNFVLII